MATFCGKLSKLLGTPVLKIHGDRAISSQAGRISVMRSEGSETIMGAPAKSGGRWYSPFHLVTNG